jgi:redox-sensitive bicupin YhaK (pirin superfamily)
MHPHKDDEILTYLRSGVVEHKDRNARVFKEGMYSGNINRTK